MLTFELLKRLPNKTKVGPGWTTVWDRQSPEILSTINYSMTLGSIIPGAPIAEHKSDPSGSQATSGTGTRLDLGLGQPLQVLSQQGPPGNRQIPQQAPHPKQQNKLLWPLWLRPWMLFLKGDLQKSRPCPESRPAGPPRSLAPQSQSPSDTGPQAPAASPAAPRYQAGEKQEEPDPATRKGDFRALLVGVQKPGTSPSPEKGPAYRRQKKVLCCFYFPCRLLKASPFSDPHWVVGEGELSLAPILSWAQ